MQGAMKRRLGCALAAGMLVLALFVPGATASHSRATPNFKRGVGSGYYLWFAPGVLTRVGATWAYNWTARAPKPVRGLEWVPMVWGPKSVNKQVIRMLRAYARSGRARYLLTFNEPDFRHEANMTPAQAAALWPALQSTGLKLGSPAPAVWAGSWLPQFMALAHRRHLRVDFIDLHFYQDFTAPDAVARMKAHLIAIWHMYHRPLWITELGTADTRVWKEPMKHTPTAARALRYMRQVTALLDSLPFVQRYAWFTDLCFGKETGCALSELFSNKHGRETALGKLYAVAR